MTKYFSGSGQYLNCKILHGGRFSSLDQLYKKFRGNNKLPSPKLNEDQKQEKGLRRKLKSFFPKSGEEQKKGLRRKLRQFSAGNL